MMKDSSPPLYQHALYEAHNLLRTQLLLNTGLSSEQRDKLVRDLRTNCLALALSLCVFTSSKSSLAWAPTYLQLSNQPISMVISTITKQFSEVRKSPCSHTHSLKPHFGSSSCPGPSLPCIQVPPFLIQAPPFLVSRSLPS